MSIDNKSDSASSSLALRAWIDEELVLFQWLLPGAQVVGNDVP
jgi:hypothetical protein